MGKHILISGNEQSRVGNNVSDLCKKYEQVKNIFI